MLKGQLYPKEEIPGWLEVNEHLTCLHRPPLYSYKACFWSIFRWHAETTNIWSHILAFLFYLYCLVDFVCLSDPVFGTNYEWNLYVLHLLCSCACFSLSFLYHMFHCHSYPVKCKCLKMDLQGIAITVFGVYLSYIYYSMYCEPFLQAVYTTFVCVGAFASMYVLIRDKYTTDKYRTQRAAILLSYGISSVVPFSHVLLRDGVFNALYDGHVGVIVLVSTVTSGTYMLLHNVPEKYWKSRLDILIHSHVIFHVLAFLGNYSMTLTLEKFRHTRASANGQC